MTHTAITALGLDIPPHRYFIAARKVLGVSQKQLAEMAGVATSTIADFERGKRSLVRNNFKAICEVFGSADIRFALDENDNICGVAWPI